MTQAIAAQTSWREKVAQGRQLIAEIKESASAGKDGAVFDGAEAQVEARAKMNQAQALFAEAKAEREASEKLSVSGADLEALERAAASFSGDPSELANAGGGSLSEILTGRSGGHAKDKAEFNPFKMGKTQLVKASASVMGRPLFEHVIPERVRESGRELARQAMRENASSVAQREIAALVEGTQANGGFLVVPQYLQEMFAAVRRQGNVLRRLGWLNIHQTEETNQVLFPKASGSLTVGLVAELAVKPTADNNYAQVVISLYTMAGIAAISRQLARSADPAIAEILAKDLAMLLGNLEEQLCYTGTGSQQPRGILNTTGTSSPLAPIGAGTSQAVGLAIIDGMLDLAAIIATNYYGPATGAVMR
ncbi:MAG: phage major capsid protein, partial [Actinomycetota bacterium]|nr:phage major capsid protein [Actinomycetota bacterium]